MKGENGSIKSKRDGVKGKKDASRDKEVIGAREKSRNGREAGSALDIERQLLYCSGNNGIPIMKWISPGSVGHRCTRQEILRASVRCLHLSWSHVCPEVQTSPAQRTFVHLPIRPPRLALRLNFPPLLRSFSQHQLPIILAFLEKARILGKMLLCGIEDQYRRRCTWKSFANPNVAFFLWF